MTHPNPSTALARVVMDELAHQGVDTVVISPGSRSGALAIAAAQHPDIETRVVIDERSAAFHALGAAKASRRPVAAVATSGSAPANFFPAVVEADMSCVPLLVISADRPAELQGIGANQTIDQRGLFGAKVRRFEGIEAPDAFVDRNEDWRRTVAGLVAISRGSTPGPVHLNVRFREPTVPVTDDGRARSEEYPFDTPRIDLDLFEDAPGDDELPTLSGERCLIVAGDGDYDRQAVAERAEELGWPILATALSGMRGGRVVSAYHHLMSGGLPAELVPDVVVAIGAIGPSQRLEALVASAAIQVRIDRWGRTIDPTRSATHVLRGSVVGLLDRATPSPDSGWHAVWDQANADCRSKLRSLLGDAPAMSGAGVVSALNDVEWGSLVAASSLPIREVDAHVDRPGKVFANRGASGIDGFVSTALGIASRRPRVLAMAGDLSVLHDSNGFLHDGQIDLTIVVVDNRGGGLFDSLPQAEHAPDFERLFVTPPGRSLEDLARFHGLGFDEAADPKTLRKIAEESLGKSGVDLIRVPVDRGADLALRAQLDER